MSMSDEEIDELLFDKGFHPCLDFEFTFNYRTVIDFFAATITHYKINIDLYKFDRSDLELLFDNYRQSVVDYSDVDYLQELVAMYSSKELLYKYKVSKEDINDIEENIDRIKRRILDGSAGKLYIKEESAK